MDSKKQLNVLAEAYLRLNSSERIEYELEVKFGTRKFKRITQSDYNNVIKQIKHAGFQSRYKSGKYNLKIIPENVEKTTQIGHSIHSNIRFDVDGLSNIQTYCKTNSMGSMVKPTDKGASGVHIMKKTDVSVSSGSERQWLKSANFDEFNFRVSLKREETVSKDNAQVSHLLEAWNETPKMFRYINRSTFTHADSRAYPFQIDLSIVKSGTGLTTSESRVFSSPETYEIEVEVIPLVAHAVYSSNPAIFVKGIENMAKMVMCGIQQTNYPTSYTEQTSVLEQYMAIVAQKQKDYRGRPVFIGPSSRTLQQKNITLDTSNESNIPNITVPYMYCATDKADGVRHLMVVDKSGKIYLINMNMKIIFTGAKTYNKHAHNSIIDGELILHDINGKFINMFAAFDIYFENNNNVRAHPFMDIPDSENLTRPAKSKGTRGESRLAKLQAFMADLSPQNIMLGTPLSGAPAHATSTTQLSELQKYRSTAVRQSPMQFICKKFYPNYNDMGNDARGTARSIFAACQTILQTDYPYERDGLIITPTAFGVGGTAYGVAGELLKKITWDFSFKWKPAEFNTNDFLVTTKKGENGQDIVTPIFQEGLDNYVSTQYQQYKTLVLRVGYDTKRHGNPYNDMLNDVFTKYGDVDTAGTYVPTQFYPTDPYDLQAGLCNVMLELDGTGTHQMFTEERDTFTDDMIVEFKYDMSKDGLWKWIPLRVRHDKTDEYNHGKSVYGNNYATANDNWYSIHYPVTQDMITGGGPPPVRDTGDVYYNADPRAKKLMVGLRHFHNLFIKKALIQNVSKRGDILIDFACGKAGDLPKWTVAELSFVFGIDISKDNLENKLDGACVRYLKNHRDNKTSPYALFVHGNSSVNVRNGAAMLNHVSKQITSAVFGSSRRDAEMPPAVLRQHGRATNGFDVSSCQFAIHYMFESNATFYNFIRNVSECTKVGGYFIGTCYDGETVFNMLRDESVVTIVDRESGKKMWEVEKDYTSGDFPAGQSSLGHKILVYQESINQVFPEFLVNFKFLEDTMKSYGFELLPRADAHSMGLPSGSEMFDKLFYRMVQECKTGDAAKYGRAVNMTDSEKQISFLNRYFIFKKLRAVNADKLTNEFMAASPYEIQYEETNQRAAQEVVRNVNNEEKSKIKKTRRKITLATAPAAPTAAPAAPTAAPAAPTAPATDDVPSSTLQPTPDVPAPTKEARPKKIKRKIIITDAA
jgi:mRNA (guanine-N7-)-methyltransferase